MRSLDPRVLELTGAAEQRVTVNARRHRWRFASRARQKRLGARASRCRRASATRPTRSKTSYPSRCSPRPKRSPPTARRPPPTPRRKRPSTIPTGVVPGFGGLDVEVSSTAMVGLGEGARYLVEYPYGCAEQKASTSLALVLAADLGDAFSLPGMDPAKMRPVGAAHAEGAREIPVRERRLRLLAGRVPDRRRRISPPTCCTCSRLAADLKYDVDRGVRERAYDYLDRELAPQPPAVNEGWWPAYTAWQAFAVKVLVEGGRNEDSHLTRLYGYRDRMPVFALAYLHDAMLAKGETTGDRVADLRRRMSNAILPEGGSAHVGELADPVSALVLELERALDGDRAELAGQGRRGRTRRCGRWCAG